MKEPIKQYLEEIHKSLNKPDKVPKSSLNQVERFTEDIVWQDIKDLIIDNIEYLREKLEIESDIHKIRLMQGGIMELKRMINAPVHLYEDIERRMEDREVESEINQKEGDNNA